MNYQTYQSWHHAWCHSDCDSYRNVSESTMRDPSSTADPDLHQDDTVDDDFVSQ